MDSIAGISIPLTNRAISQQLNEAQDILQETEKEQLNLTQDGKKIIHAAEELLDDTKLFVNEKNPNDTLYQMIREGQSFYNDIQTNRRRWNELQKILTSSQNEFDSTILLKKMESISKTAKLVAIELVASPNFRQTLWDFFSVLYAILVDASQIEKIGKPLHEAFESLSFSNSKDIKEKLKDVSENAIAYGLDIIDDEKDIIVLTNSQRDELWQKLQNILNEMSKNERTQRMFRSIFDLLDMFLLSMANLTTEISNESTKLYYDKHIQNILCLAEQLFESFTRVPMDIIISHLKVVYASILEDEELTKGFIVLKNMIFEVLENPDLLLHQNFKDFKNVIAHLFNSIQQKKELKYNFTILRDEFDKIIWSIEKDPINQKLQNDIKNLVEMIFLDNYGRVVFKPEMLDQLKLILLSSVVKRLRIPLPEINVNDTNSSFHFKVNGLILGIQDILPERIIAQNKGVAVMNVKDKSLEKNYGKKFHYFDSTFGKAVENFKITFENINVHMPEADIWFHKKTFPEIEDKGKVSIDIGGSGMDLIFALNTKMGSEHLFNLESVECLIHELGLTLSDTAHDSIYNILIALFKGTVKRNIEDAIQESMAGVFEQLNKQIEKQIESLKGNVPSILHSLH